MARFPNQECLFAVRIVHLDYVLARPEDGLDHAVSPLTRRTLRNVPVIRLFGSTPRGQKTCLHVHRVYRYFYVPFEPGGGADAQRVQVQLLRLATDLDTALQDALDKARPNTDGSWRPPPSAHVFNLTIHVRPLPCRACAPSVRPPAAPPCRS
jgi:DNA polymerase zeta